MFTQKLTLVVGIVLLLIKFTAYFLTQSNTILTDALESIVNVVAGAFGLFSLSVAALPKDENHPYGHGKIEFISAAVEGILILVAGILIIGKSSYSLLYPSVIQAIDLGIILTAIAGGINYALGVYVEREGRATDSIVLIASGEHLQSDGYSTLGMIIGLTLLWWTEWIWLDALVAILFGLIIIYTGIQVIRAAMAGIMDEVDGKLVKEIVKVLNHERNKNCIDVHNLRVIKYGTALHIDCHITIPWFFDTRAAHETVEELEELLKANTEKSVECFIHVDPCIPPCCKVCTKQDCPERQFPFQQQLEWTVENITMNQKHFYAEQSKNGEPPLMEPPKA